MEFDIVRKGTPNVRIEKVRALYAQYSRWIIGVLILVILGITTAVWVLSPSTKFPVNSIVTIPKDAPASTFGHILKEEGVIRSEFAFKMLARVSGYDHHLDTGAYVFKKPTSLLAVLSRIAHGQHGIEAMHITFTEGMTHYDMANTLEAQLPGFDKAEFLKESSTSEGYLFPETYFFMPGDAPGDIILHLKSQFSESIATITPQIMASKHSFADSVIIASLLEREAKGLEDKRIVAGILWNRIAKNMPLQVDAVFGYIHQQNGYTPTATDLQSDSPYNTPISNPGLESLLAAVTPAKTNYFYYLTGTDGKMHYAVTFEEHKKNRELYLK
jgi:UPF0755 protein